MPRYFISYALTGTLRGSGFGNTVIDTSFDIATGEDIRSIEADLRKTIPAEVDTVVAAVAVLHIQRLPL